MGVEVVARDLVTLPASLLALAKQHCRIDHAGDDTLLTSILARAIARFEATNEGTLNETEVLWLPKLADFVDGNATVPVRPVKAIEVADGEGADVSAAYALEAKWDSIHGVQIQVLRGAAVADLAVMLTCGMDPLDPDVLDVVLRHTAHLYEHREILIPGREYVAPDLRLNATWWMPRI